MMNKIRMIEAAIGTRPVSCFVGPLPTLLATLASLSRTDNPDSLAWKCMIVMWCMWKESNG